jgi:hypothetical protein
MDEGEIKGIIKRRDMEGRYPAILEDELALSPLNNPARSWLIHRSAQQTGHLGGRGQFTCRDSRGDSCHYGPHRRLYCKNLELVLFSRKSFEFSQKKSVFARTEKFLCFVNNQFPNPSVGRRKKFPIRPLTPLTSPLPTTYFLFTRMKRELAGRILILL